MSTPSRAAVILASIAFPAAALSQVAAQQAAPAPSEGTQAAPPVCVPPQAPPPQAQNGGKQKEEVPIAKDMGAAVGGTVGQTAGAAVAGPIGAAAGGVILSKVGEAVGSIVKKKKKPEQRSANGAAGQQQAQAQPLEVIPGATPTVCADGPPANNAPQNR